MIFVRILLCLLLVAHPVHAQAPASSWDDGSVPYVQTPMEVVDRMLTMAKVGPGDRLIDLGSGDGRIVIEAAKRGASALGVDLDKSLVRLATEHARAAGVADRARFEVRDIFATDLHGATVIAMYLLPEVNAKLMPRLLALKPGTRIVSHDWGIGDWPFDERLEMRVPEKSLGLGGATKVNLWIVPAHMAGTWRGTIAGDGGEWSMRVKQKYQRLDIDAVVQGEEAVVRASRLRGTQIELLVDAKVGGRALQHFFVGRVQGDTIEGTVSVSDGGEPRTFAWRAKRAR